MKKYFILFYRTFIGSCHVYFFCGGSFFPKGFQNLVYILEMLGTVNILKISGLSFDGQTRISKFLQSKSELYVLY